LRVKIKLFMGAAIVEVRRPDRGRRDHRELSSVCVLAAQAARHDPSRRAATERGCDALVG